MHNLAAYEKYLINQLTAENSHAGWEQLLTYHQTQIEYLQTERLVHLLVTIAFAIFSLICVLTTIVFKINELFMIDSLFLFLLVPYIFHYYKLENTLQRWYQLTNKIYRHLGVIPKNYPN